MPTWATRGLQTALVTGGLLMLGTSIASATENVNPDQPPSPLDGGLDAPLTEVPVATGAGLDNTATRTGGDVTPSNEWGVLSGDLYDPPLGELTPDTTMVRVPTDVVTHAVEHRADVPVDTEEDAQFGPTAAADSLLRVDQVPVLGDLFTIPHLRTTFPGAPLSTLDLTQQFPAIGRLGGSGVDVTRQFPAVPAEITQRLPLVGDGPVLPAQRVQSHPGIRPVTHARPTTQDLPAPYQPMTGQLAVPAAPALPGQLPVPANLPVNPPSLPAVPAGAPPVSASLPTLNRPPVPSLPAVSTQAVPAVPTVPGGTAAPGVPTMPVLPDLPPVPTLPAMPPLPSRPSTQDLPALPIPKVNTPDLFTPAVPVAGQDVPAGATQQLMAQLRGLISDLENTASGGRVQPLEPPAL